MMRFSFSARTFSFLALSSALQACSGDEEGGSSAAVLTQAPHCEAGRLALRMEGSVDGATVNDQRAEDGSQISAGFENLSQLEFDTPTSNSAVLPASALELHFVANRSLLNGQTAAIVLGTLVAPVGAAHAGQTLCITGGEVGMVDGGSEDEALKFRVTELRASADCTGDVLPVELRGCFQ